MGCKFICLFCDDMVICEDCESLHQHPCVKIKNHVISDKNTLLKIVDFSQLEIKRKGFFDKTKEFIFGSSTSLKARLKTPDNKTEFYANPNTEFSFKIQVENLSNSNLPQNTHIISLNTRELNFQILRIEGIFPAKAVVTGELKCMIPNKIGTYKLRIIFFHHLSPINVNR